MGTPGAPRPLENRYGNHPMLPRGEPDELDLIEVRKEEKPMGICSVEGCGKKTVGRGLCRSHYDKDRPKRPKSETKPPSSETKAPLPKSTTSPDKPDLSTNLLPGDLYLVARIPLEQIRVMTVEQLREMCRCAHA